MVETQITAGRPFTAFSEISEARFSAGQYYLLGRDQFFGGGHCSHQHMRSFDGEKCDGGQRTEDGSSFTINSHSNSSCLAKIPPLPPKTSWKSASPLASHSQRTNSFKVVGWMQPSKGCRGELKVDSLAEGQKTFICFCWTNIIYPERAASQR